MQKRKLATDIVWNVSALVMMNGVLQFAVYPRLSSQLGAEAFGDILYVMGILAIFAPATGTAANNTRLIVRQNMAVKNGDFLLPMCSMTALYTLLGKTAALLVGPLNGIVIGYLTKGNVRISKRQFYLSIGLCTAIGAVLYAAIIVATPIFVQLLYPDIAKEVLKIASLGNLSQVICFSASLLLTVMLTFSDVKWQFFIQGTSGISFLLLGIVGTQLFGITGFVVAGLAANCLRFSLTALAGMIQTG